MNDSFLCVKDALLRFQDVLYAEIFGERYIDLTFLADVMGG